jgi:hypothetical protein
MTISATDLLDNYYIYVVGNASNDVYIMFVALQNIILNGS